MNLEDIYNYIKNNKNELKEFQAIKLSKCYSNYFQIRLVNQKESYILKEIHYEIRTTDVKNQFNLEIHFEEFDTTRYEQDQELSTLIKNNDFEFFSWWTGKNKKNNQDNKSIRYKNPYTILGEDDLKKFIHFLYETFAMFNDTLIRVYKRKDVGTMMGINLMKTKNILLYGAPGVGKTHNYKRLVTMIENGDDEKSIFDAIATNESTANFDSLHFETIKNEKRIEFVTFHQSYSYEDFIEGYRPNEDGRIELEDGIFKSISQKAQNEYTLDIDLENIDFSDYLEVGQEFSTIHNKKFKIIKIDENITFKHLATDGEFIAYRKTIIKHLKDEQVMQNSEYYSSQVYIARYIYNQLQKSSMANKNHYIIIDEINRGNISKIFGELITLIEEDKRDSYEVTLPYSKEKFKIPSNLYIIATMNSTDKSIATMDIALRRRFTFIKMQPNPALVANEEARRLMIALNSYIKEKIGEEYQLGHSYFMGEEIDLEFIKEYKIKPLLEEYFYGNSEGYREAIEKMKKA